MIESKKLTKKEYDNINKFIEWQYNNHEDEIDMVRKRKDRTMPISMLISHKIEYLLLKGHIKWLII
jgi:hypothetical protein